MTTKKIWNLTFFLAFTILFLIILSTALFPQGKNEQKTDSDKYLQLFQYVYSFVQNNYVDVVEPQVLYEGAIKGMLEAIGDPYTSYVDSKSLLGTNLKDTTSGSFGGVGLSISKPISSTPEKPAWVEVASPIEDTPGWKAGIQPGDYLTAINGTPTQDITMEEVLNLLRGPVGTDVSVQVKRGTHLNFEVTLTRAIIEVPTVKYTMMDDGIAYLRIIEFTPLTPERVQEALNSFRKSSYKGLIIDLRNNPGGLITSVVEVANKFIDNGVIVSTQSRISFENREFKANSFKKTFDNSVPIVVLLNKGSASASEILAGALKDYHLAYIMGETSYGKGSVQQVLDLFNDDAMKITIARYYTPSGANIDSTGIIPDTEVLFPSLTPEEEKTLNEFLKTTTIDDFFKQHPQASLADVNKYANELYKTWPVNIRFLKKLLTQEYYRTRIAPMYDLDYDVQLNEAVRFIQQENIPELLKSTKTVRELQLDLEKEQDLSKSGAPIAKTDQSSQSEYSVDALIPAF